MGVGASSISQAYWPCLCYSLGFFLAKNLLPSGVKPKLLLILGLGALQGGIGWWMVSSGLVHRTEVAQERLAIHLIIAALIFASCIWIAGGLGPVQPMIIHEHKRRLKLESILIMIFTCLQIFLGGLVAGLRAGLVNNSWPLIDGVFIPLVPRCGRSILGGLIY